MLERNINVSLKISDEKVIQEHGIVLRQGTNTSIGLVFCTFVDVRPKAHFKIEIRFDKDFELHDADGVAVSVSSRKLWPISRLFWIGKEAIIGTHSIFERYQRTGPLDLVQSMPFDMPGRITAKEASVDEFPVWQAQEGYVRDGTINVLVRRGMLRKRTIPDESRGRTPDEKMWAKFQRMKPPKTPLPIWSTPLTGDVGKAICFQFNNVCPQIAKRFAKATLHAVSQQPGAQGKELASVEDRTEDGARIFKRSLPDERGSANERPHSPTERLVKRTKLTSLSTASTTSPPSSYAGHITSKTNVETGQDNDRDNKMELDAANAEQQPIMIDLGTDGPDFPDALKIPSPVSQPLQQQSVVEMPDTYKEVGTATSDGEEELTSQSEARGHLEIQRVLLEKAPEEDIHTSTEPPSQQQEDLTAKPDGDAESVPEKELPSRMKELNETSKPVESVSGESSETTPKSSKGKATTFLMDDDKDDEEISLFIKDETNPKAESVTSAHDTLRIPHPSQYQSVAKMTASGAYQTSPSSQRTAAPDIENDSEIRRLRLEEIRMRREDIRMQREDIRLGLEENKVLQRQRMSELQG